MSESWQDRIHSEADMLRTTRDELRVQLHLGAAEARDTWDALEDSWHQLEARLSSLGHATSEAAEDLETATKLLLGEIKHGYERIRAVL